MPRVPDTSPDRHEAGSGARRHDGRSRRHRVVLAGCAVAVLGLMTSCALADPPGAAPLRYRDAIFTSTTKTADVTYGTATNTDGTTATLTADVYRPVGDRVTRRPFIVWVHGGSFSGGSKTSPEIVDESTQFALKGYVTISINYRLGAGCLPVSDECVTNIFNADDDARTAVKFFRDHASTYGIDPTRVAIGGSSAGAIIANDVGYGATQTGSPALTPRVNAVASISGGAVFNNFIDANDAPSLLFHGDADGVVNISSSQSTVDVATQQGAEAFLIKYAGAGHVPYAQNRADILHKTTNFFYFHLDAANAAR